MTDERILAEALANKPLFTRKDVAQRYGVDLRTVDRWQQDLLRPVHSCKGGPRWTFRELILFELQRLPVLRSKSEGDKNQLKLLPDA